MCISRSHHQLAQRLFIPVMVVSSLVNNVGAKLQDRVHVNVQDQDSRLHSDVQEANRTLSDVQKKLTILAHDVNFHVYGAKSFHRSNTILADEKLSWTKHSDSASIAQPSGNATIAMVQKHSALKQNSSMKRFGQAKGDEEADFHICVACAKTKLTVCRVYDPAMATWMKNKKQKDAAGEKSSFLEQQDTMTRMETPVYELDPCQYITEKADCQAVPERLCTWEKSETIQKDFSRFIKATIKRGVPHEGETSFEIVDDYPRDGEPETIDISKLKEQGGDNIAAKRACIDASTGTDASQVSESIINCVSELDLCGPSEERKPSALSSVPRPGPAAEKVGLEYCSAANAAKRKEENKKKKEEILNEMFPTPPPPSTGADNGSGYAGPDIMHEDTNGAAKGADKVDSGSSSLLASAAIFAGVIELCATNVH